MAVRKQMITIPWEIIIIYWNGTVEELILPCVKHYLSNIWNSNTSLIQSAWKSKNPLHAWRVSLHLWFSVRRQCASKWLWYDGVRTHKIFKSLLLSQKLLESNLQNWVSMSFHLGIFLYGTHQLSQICGLSTSVFRFFYHQSCP